MEPDVMPLHSSSSRPPLDGDEEAGSEEEDEFGDFGGFSVVVSCSHPGFADWTESPAGTKPHPLGFNPPVEQSQPASTGDSGTAGSRVHLTNGYPEGDPGGDPGPGACSPREETGFADFSVFAEQAAHPWCCGVTPTGGEERWDVRVERSARQEHAGDPPGREVVLDSEPRSRGARERGDAARLQPPREGGELHSGEELGEERRRGFKSSRAEDVQKDGDRSASALPQTFGSYESASEDPASFSDDLSLECPSADLEPNVSSLVSQEDQTDWDQTDDDNDEEELDRYRPPDLAAGGFHYGDQSATQGTCAASNQSRPGPHAEEDSHPAFKDGGSEHRGVRGRGNLPPSDSFADFCSAPEQEDGDGSWAEFKDQRAVEEEEEEEEEEQEEPGGLQTDGVAEEDQTRPGRLGGSGRNSYQGSLSCRVQQLLLACYPEVEVPAAEGEEEEKEEVQEVEVQVPSLGALLHARLLPDSEEEEEEEEDEEDEEDEEEEEEEEEEEIPELCLRSNWIHQDLHDAVGLRFQWGGSHTNRTLLRCLGVETRNIVFIGIKKQPVAVPAFASSLGMLEPTKDSPEPRDTPEPSTDSTQEALPPGQPAWSGRGVSGSQDGTSPRRAPHF